MSVGDERQGGARELAPQTRALLQWLDANELTRTQPQPCSYLPGRTASMRAFAAEQLDGDSYHELMDRGFRRSGRTFYTTDCGPCRACVPLRVPVATFRPTKSQRRVLRRNADVQRSVRAPAYTPDTFELYRRYLRHQHPDTVQSDDEASFRESFFEPVVDSIEVRYTLGERLIAWSLLDVCARSLSSVYHFFEPDHARRSLGVFSVLAEIELARSAGVPFYYLGYWVEGSRTMQYKAGYGPHELLRDGTWR